jgi:osmoprotectant transport system ATP-binding protein
MSGIAVEFREVSKNYGSGYVLENFNLQIPREKIVTIIGPSGCGKTTLLKMINRLIEPESGAVLLEDKDISTLDPVELRRNIGYVIQQIGLFPHMTIEQNISIVPRLKGEKKQELSSRVEELLELIGLDPVQFRRRYPHELSGGQQQRIGVARALAANPSIILMDEPFSALDPISRVQLQKELIKLNERVKKTIVFVTHDIDEALKIADQVVLLKDGQIVQSSTPKELLDRPANDFVKEFVGVEKFNLAYSI